MTDARPSLDPSRLCQIEIPVSDMPKALAFYEAAFGWRAAPAELHEYVVLETPLGCPYGLSLVRKRDVGASGGVTVYFASDDPEALCRHVESLGGRRRFGPVQLPGYGTIYQVEDPFGCRWGLFQRSLVRVS